MTRAPKASPEPAAARASTAPPASRAVTVVPATLAGAVIALQVAYPLTDGVARDRLTVAVVVAFAAASVTHAAVRRGRAFAGVLVAAAGGVGLGVELVGVATGWPFGAYRYSGTLGPEAGGVPLVIALAWVMMAYPALVMARHVTRRAVVGVPLAAWALTAWDLFLDPQMVADGHWRWMVDGAYLGVPLSNYAGWLATSLTMAAALWVAADRAERRRLPLAVAGGRPRRGDAVPVTLYVWTWIGSVLAHAVFLGLPTSAAVGGVGMGVVVLAWLATARRA